MNRQQALDLIKKFPDTPGVYFFRSGSDVLYIGKATSLRDRVKSYLSSDITVTRGPKIVKMLTEFDSITVEKTDSVLEALLMEAHLIKTYQPLYNTKEKDDKSFYYVVVTKEDFPRVLLVRGRDVLVSALSKEGTKKIDYKIAQSFGPFPSGPTIREALKLIRKIFPYRDKCTPCIKNPTPGVGDKCKPCFNRQIGLCPGVCSGEITQEDYNLAVGHIVRFFRGEKKAIIKDLEKHMKALAKEKRFEEAGKAKHQIFALNHIHDVSLIKEESWEEKTPRGFRIESYDIAHMSGANVVGVMTVVEDGEIEKAEYRKFKIKEDPGVNDTKALKEVVRRRLGHNEWRLPGLIVVDGGLAQKRAVEAVLKENKVGIPVVSVVKDERHKPKEILGDRAYLVYEKEILLSNAEAHRYAIGFHKELRSKGMRGT
ncbi:MAG: GIY-YIG nuclease family protein [Candidatus Zambryskibacteria bacterium]|nr:GIY-YIG nuclease family protein [Candidatus Zambryskibacteria bacterium]